MNELSDDVLVEVALALPVRDVARLTIAAPLMTHRPGLMGKIIEMQRLLLQQAGVDCTPLPSEEPLRLKYIARLSGGLNAVPAWFVLWVNFLNNCTSNGTTLAPFTWAAVKRLWAEEGALYFPGLLQFMPRDQDDDLDDELVGADIWRDEARIPPAYHGLRQALKVAMDDMFNSCQGLRRSQCWGVRDWERAMECRATRSQALDVVHELEDDDDDDDDDEDYAPSDEDLSEDEEAHLEAEAAAVQVEHDAWLDAVDEAEEYANDFPMLPEECDSPMCPCTPCGSSAVLNLYKDMPGPVAAAAFAGQPDFGPKPLRPRTFMDWRAHGRHRTRHGRVLHSAKVHHPTRELLLEELLATRRPTACARSHMMRGLALGRLGYGASSDPIKSDRLPWFCEPCD